MLGIKTKSRETDFLFAACSENNLSTIEFYADLQMFSNCVSGLQGPIKSCE